MFYMKKPARLFKGMNKNASKSVLCRIRMALGMSQADLAKALGWNAYQCVSRLERTGGLPESYERRVVLNKLGKQAIEKIREKQNLPEYSSDKKKDELRAEIMAIRNGLLL